MSDRSVRTMPLIDAPRVIARATSAAPRRTHRTKAAHAIGAASFLIRYLLDPSLDPLSTSLNLRFGATGGKGANPNAAGMSVSRLPGLSQGQLPRTQNHCRGRGDDRVSNYSHRSFPGFVPAAKP